MNQAEASYRSVQGNQTIWEGTKAIEIWIKCENLEMLRVDTANQKDAGSS